MHEVGHALGLRHNFRASTVYPLAKLSDPAWGRERGLAGSVMDYNPINIAANGEGQGAYFESTIGPYDYWAIEYAYRDLPKEAEADELEKIAARGSTDPLLAFSSDEEAIAGIDPDASRFDLGSDPLVYLQKRLLISQELWQRLQTKKLKPGESYAVLRRTFDAGFRQFARSAALIAKYVGGVYYVRDYAGTSQLPLTPVPGSFFVIVLPLTMIRPAKSRVPESSRSPSTIHTPEPSTLPAPMLTVPALWQHFGSAGSITEPQIGVPLPVTWPTGPFC